jgi:hypothetical protein
MVPRQEQELPLLTVSAANPRKSPRPESEWAVALRTLCD